MSFGFLGIQFGFALQNANVSRIFETLGANLEDSPLLWVAAPVTGLLIQPIIGHMSDNTWGRLGRRRPYFLVGAILASVALFIMPNSPVLWVAAGMLWIMDASINISMEPFRAFVGDLLPPEQRTAGFAMQSFFIGTGAVVASMLPWIFSELLGFANTAPEGQIAPSVKYSFYIGGLVFFLAVLWTIIRTREYSPEEMAEFTAAEEADTAGRHQVHEGHIAPAPLYRNGIIWLVVGTALTAGFVAGDLEKELFIITVGSAIFGLIQIFAGWMTQQKNTENGFVEVINDLYRMPKTMKQLALVQFFSWFALFSMWIYTTSAVTAHVYGTSDTTSVLYNQGADWVGVCFAVYNGIAAVVAFFLPQLAKLWNRRVVHAICLVAGGIGLASIFVIKDPNLLLASMVGVGIAWASILSMPYAILSGALPPAKMGVYMGIFNFFIVIPQMVAASILGFLLAQFFAKEAVYALILGGISMLIAAVLVLRVYDVDEELMKKAQQ
jgi:maltose/moltooligosaccharide transporter